MRKYFKKYWWVLIVVLAVVGQEIRINNIKQKQAQVIGTGYMYGWFMGAQRGTEIVKYRVKDPNLIVRRAAKDSVLYMNTLKK